MTRVKGGKVTHLRHKKVLKYNKGNFGTRHNLFKRANETMLKSLWYAYRDRRNRKRDLRRLWITRINAASRLNLAVRDPKAFSSVVEKAKTAI